MAALLEGTLARILVPLAIAALLVLQVVAVRYALAVALDHDEAEYLHSSWLMSQGQRIYRDFMEDHPPYFFQALHWLEPSATTPAFPRLDVRAWTARSRASMAICGTLAAICAAIVVARSTRNRAAGLLAGAIVIGSYWTWWRGILQIRPDAPTLFLFWAGLMLLLWSDDADHADAIRSGIGLALVVAAELANPKWPLCGLVIGLFFLRKLVRVARRGWHLTLPMVLPSVAVVVIAILTITAAETTLRDYIYFNFTLKSANMERFRHAPWVVRTFNAIRPFSFAGPFSQPLFVLVAFAVVVSLYRRVIRSASSALDRVAILELMALMLAAAIEVRFIYTYPCLWPQYYLMWSFVAAAVAGIAFSFIEVMMQVFRDAVRTDFLVILSVALSLFTPPMILFRAGSGVTVFDRVAIGAAIVAIWLPTILLLASLVVREPVPPASFVHLWTIVFALAIGTGGVTAVKRTDERLDVMRWRMMSFMQRTLRPEETVWLSATIHPIAARDASYYWYSPQDLIPDTLEYVRERPQSREFLPALTEADLPPCVILRGGPSTLRYTMAPDAFAYLPEASRCLSELAQRGILVPTAMPGVSEIRRPAGVAR